MNFFKKNGNMKSTKDLKNEEKQRNSLINELMNMGENNEWKGMRSLNYKKTLIKQFVINKLRINYNMTNVDVKKTIALINLHIFLKNITNEHIILKDGKIHKILNLKYNKDKKRIEIEYERKTILEQEEKNINPKEFKEYENPKKNFIELWTKFTENYEK